MARTPIVEQFLSYMGHAVWPVALVMVAALAACGDGNYAPQKDDAPRAGPSRKFDPDAPSVFGEGGLTVGTIRRSTGLFGGTEEGGRLPVNKYIWQAALDTVSFLPLASTDPFTGVIATDWGSTDQVPGERFKVSVFVTSPALSAASLKVAVYHEVQNEAGVWVPAPVSPETPLKLEDAILTRAREIRIAEREGRASG